MENPTPTDLLILGLGPRPTAEFANAMLGGLEIDSAALPDPALVGAIVALHQLLPDLAYWSEETGATLLAAATAQAATVDHSGVEWNHFYLGRWAVLGDQADLDELIRRAKHRDGTTAALVTGTEAVVMLTAAFKEHTDTIGKRLLEAGFNPANVTTGNFPHQAQPAPVDQAAQPAPPTSHAVAVRPITPAPVTAPAPPANPIVIATPGGVIGVGVDANSGVVILAGNPISITAAMALETDLVKRTRELLIPASSYAWMDEFDHSKGGLFTEDVPPESNPTANVFGRGLPRPDGHESVACHGEVIQDKQTGQYSCRLYNRAGGGGFSQIADKIDDFNDAKFRVASAAKAELLSMGLLTP
jgi:hypothetical protein